MKKISLLILVALCVAFAGCRQGTIANVSDQAVPAASSSKKPRTTADVRNAIIKGCAERGWVARDLAPDKIRAVIDVRGKHHAEVDIPYDATKYSIVYVTSTGLKAEGGTIHSQYNAWVLNLKESIDKFLMLE